MVYLSISRMRFNGVGVELEHLCDLLTGLIRPQRAMGSPVPSLGVGNDLSRVCARAKTNESDCRQEFLHGRTSGEPVAELEV